MPVITLILQIAKKMGWAFLSQKELLESSKKIKMMVLLNLLGKTQLIILQKMKTLLSRQAMPLTLWLTRSRNLGQ